MSRPVGGAWRWARAGVVATMAAAVGTAAHASAGGLLPGPTALLVLLVALVAGTAAALGSPAGYGRLLALVGGGQAVVHVVLIMAAGHGGTGPAGLPHAGHAHPGHAPAVPEVDPVTLALAHVAADLSGANALMTLLHLAAAAAVAGWLVLGERAVWALVVLVGALALARLHAVLGLLPAPHAGPRLDRPATVAPASPFRRTVLAGPLTRRGPPRLCVLPPPTA